MSASQPDPIVPEQPAKPETEEKKPGSLLGLIFGILAGVIFLFLFHYGAARLSFNTNGSYLWSFLSFIFATLYYPYYAFFVSTPMPAPVFGGRRR